MERIELKKNKIGEKGDYFTLESYYTEVNYFLQKSNHIDVAHSNTEEISFSVDIDKDKKITKEYELTETEALKNILRSLESGSSAYFCLYNKHNELQLENKYEICFKLCEITSKDKIILTFYITSGTRTLAKTSHFDKDYPELHYLDIK